jgi:hypothetical protein
VIAGSSPDTGTYKRFLGGRHLVSELFHRLEWNRKTHHREAKAEYVVRQCVHYRRVTHRARLASNPQKMRFWPDWRQSDLNPRFDLQPVWMSALVCCRHSRVEVTEKPAC